MAVTNLPKAIQEVQHAWNQSLEEAQYEAEARKAEAELEDSIQHAQDAHAYGMRKNQEILDIEEKIVGIVADCIFIQFTGAALGKLAKIGRAGKATELAEAFQRAGATTEELAEFARITNIPNKAARGASLAKYFAKHPHIEEAVLEVGGRGAIVEEGANLAGRVNRAGKSINLDKIFRPDGKFLGRQAANNPLIRTVSPRQANKMIQDLMHAGAKQVKASSTYPKVP